MMRTHTGCEDRDRTHRGHNEYTGKHSEESMGKVQEKEGIQDEHVRCYTSQYSVLSC